MIKVGEVEAKAENIKPYYEYYQSEDGCDKCIMYHPDLGWGMYVKYIDDYEREDDWMRAEVAEELSYGGWYRLTL